MNSTLKKMIYLNATDKKENEQQFSHYEARYSNNPIQLDTKFNYLLNKLPEIR